MRRTDSALAAAVALVALSLVAVGASEGDGGAPGGGGKTPPPPSGAAVRSTGSVAESYRTRSWRSLLTSRCCRHSEPMLCRAQSMRPPNGLAPPRRFRS